MSAETLEAAIKAVVQNMEHDRKLAGHKILHTLIEEAQKAVVLLDGHAELAEARQATIDGLLKQLMVNNVAPVNAMFLLPYGNCLECGHRCSGGNLEMSWDNDGDYEMPAPDYEVFHCPRPGCEGTLDYDWGTESEIREWEKRNNIQPIVPSIKKS
jgi:hypothetical protein